MNYGETTREPHTLAATELSERFGTALGHGLSADRLCELRSRYGFNELVSGKPVPVWRKLLQQFNELVVWILLAAALLSGLLQDWTDAVVILLVVAGMCALHRYNRPSFHAQHTLGAKRVCRRRRGEPAS